MNFRFAQKAKVLKSLIKNRNRHFYYILFTIIENKIISRIESHDNNNKIHLPTKIEKTSGFIFWKRLTDKKKETHN